MEGEQINIAILRQTDQAGTQPPDTLSARALLRLPPEERERILAAAAARAEADYRTNPTLTDGFRGIW